MNKVNKVRLERHWQTMRRCRQGSEQEAYYAELIRKELLGGLDKRQEQQPCPPAE